MENFPTGFFMFIIVLAILMIACKWIIYQKAGKPGWAAIIPIYDTLVMLEIIRKPWWWLLLLLIPGVNIIFAVWAINLLAKSFGKTEAFTIGLLLLPVIFYPILAFDKSVQYIYTAKNEVNEIGADS